MPSRLRAVFLVVGLCAALFSLQACGSSSESYPADGDSDAGSAADGDSDAASDALPFEPASATAAPNPMEAGPFPVGVKTIDFYDNSRITEETGKPRHLRTEIWYPATQAFKDGPFEAIDVHADAKDADLGTKRATFDSLTIATIPTKAVRDAEMDRSHGPYPVVLFSHGANGIRWQSVFYTVHLASHGYIVVAMDHEYNTLWDIIRDGYDQAAVISSAPKRLDDVTFILTQILALNDKADDFFHASMQPENVGLTGHSFGGFTAFAAPCLDARFKVIVPQAPVISLAMIAGGCDITNYPVPVLMQGGTLDKTLGWHDQYCGYRQLTAPEQFLEQIRGAGHFTFSDICLLDLASLADKLDFGNARDALSDGCSTTTNINWDIAHQSINFYATAFFNTHLRGSTASSAFLAAQTSPTDIFSPVDFFTGNKISADYPGGTCTK